MNGSLRRIAAIVRVDFLVRFRRISTLVLFLLLSAFAYVWLPAPSTGRTLIQINEHRAIYNSGAIGMGTASLGDLRRPLWLLCHLQRHPQGCRDALRPGGGFNSDAIE